MHMKRYILQFITQDGDYFHCLGYPKDRTDIVNAHLMSETSLLSAIAKNAFIWVGRADGGSDKVALPYRILEVECEVK